jgi:hypothetical protein
MQDLLLCEKKFATLICRPIAAQFMRGDVIALMEFEKTPDGVRLAAEKHYRLVLPDEITDDEIRLYAARPTNE